MKNKIILFSIYGLLLGFTFSTQAQDLTNRQKLDQFGEQKISLQQDELLAAIKVANKLNLSLRGIYGLNGIGMPEYHTNSNNTAAGTTGTISLRNNFGLDGTGMTIGIWECCNDGANPGSVPLLTHQDFGSRITIKDGTPAANHFWHATHVAGTLIGSPPSSGSQQSKGMAHKANADAYGINGDSGEMSLAGAASIADVTAGKLLISNHSYGSTAGWVDIGGNKYIWFGGTSTYNQNGTCSYFGEYNSRADDWDEIARLAEYYLICKSAGNDRGDVPPSGAQVQNLGDPSFVTYNPAIHPGPDGDSAGYQTTAHTSNAKNILTVGAVNNSKNISSFSGFGPTNDGRIKPDICGVGVGVLSAHDQSNTTYATSNGTSMASPQVAGSLLLLQELYNDKYGFGSDKLYMKAATLKALIINSATDRGNTGPDYSYGFGVLDAEKAGDFIEADAATPSDSNNTVLIIEDVIESASDVFEIEFELVAGAQRRLTLVYNDVAGSTLVNDLDLHTVQLSSGGVGRPYKLNPANPAAVATRGNNDIDNVKHMYNNNLTAGTYRAVVSVEGSLDNNEPQPFSLVISGIKVTCPASINHKSRNLASGYYVADDLIMSSAAINPGTEITYATDGAIVLKPGFHGKAQTSTGAGYFKSASGSCN